jgi:DNA-binding transcriptional regulator YhcF (GntR family)
MEYGSLIYKKNMGRFVIEDKDFIKKIQIALAKEKTEKFFLSMYNIGFTKDEVISMLGII